MLQIPFTGGNITGEIVDVLLPKGWIKHRNGSDALSTHGMLKVRTVYLQVGDQNTAKIDRLDIAEGVPDCLTTDTENNRLVIRVLRRNGSVEELLLVDGENRDDQTIDIHANFVRIITPSDEESGLQEFRLDSEVKDAVHVQIGDRNRIVIGAGCYPNVSECYQNVSDRSRPVLRVLRMPLREPIPCLKSERDFPNLEKDHLVVLDITEFTEKKIEYNFPKDSPGEEAKYGRGDCEVKVQVHRCGNDEKMEEDGFLFQKDSSLSYLQGLVGFWFRFQEPKTRYFIKFSLCKSQTSSPTIDELLDERTISVETCESIRAYKTHTVHKRRRRFPETKLQDVSFPAKVNGSLPAEVNANTNSSETCESKKVDQYETHIYEEQSCWPREVSIPAEVSAGSPALNDFLERWNSLMKVLLPLRDNGEWEKFDNEVKRLLNECADRDVRIALVLEQGMAACCRNELKVAEAFIREASRMFPTASSNLKSLFKGRASCYLAGIYRRDKFKLGRAQKCIESAKNHLRNTAFDLDQGLLAYEEGSLILEYGRKPCLLEQAKGCFERCYELCSKGTQNNPFLRKHHFALVDEKRRVAFG